MNKKATTAAACLMLGLACASQITIDSSTRQLRDSEGRSVIFHGVNVVYKVAPYIP
jgi:endoglycosylceramidase